MVDAPPDAPGLLEAVRAAGYSAQSAVADLVDNAVAAGATSVQIGLEAASGGYDLVIEDDGHGLEAAALIQAMRFSATPTARAGHDLGRFGLGMKAAALHLSSTASMSLDTRTAQGTGGKAGWSLDGVRAHGWQLVVEPPDRDQPGSTLRVHQPFFAPSETVTAQEAERELSALFTHLGMVYTVLIARGLRLRVQGRPVPALDVLGEQAEGVRSFGPYSFPGSRATVQGWVLSAAEPDPPPLWLPARSVLAGLHVRRGGRAITLGGWEALSRRGFIPSDRVRLLVSIAPEEGDAWGIDLTKSRMRVPPEHLDRLREIAGDLVGRAQRGRTVRQAAGPGRRLPDTGENLWLPDGRISRRHPLVLAFDADTYERLEALLGALEGERE